MVNKNFISFLPNIVSLFLDYFSGHTLSAYLVLELSVVNHQYWLLEDCVMIVLLLQLLNTPLINGNLLETFNKPDVVIEQLQIKIEFMSSVEMEHCKTFHIKSALIIDLFSKTEIWSLDENDDTVNTKIAEPKLDEYSYYPELLIVDSDFCTRK